MPSPDLNFLSFGEFSEMEGIAQAVATAASSGVVAELFPWVALFTIIFAFAEILLTAGGDIADAVFGFAKKILTLVLVWWSIAHVTTFMQLGLSIQNRMSDAVVSGVGVDPLSPVSSMGKALTRVIAIAGGDYGDGTSAAAKKEADQNGAIFGAQ